MSLLIILCIFAGGFGLGMALMSWYDWRQLRKGQPGANIPFSRIRPVPSQSYRTNVIPPKPEKPPIVLVREDSGRPRFLHRDGSITT